MDLSGPSTPTPTPSTPSVEPKISIERIQWTEDMQIVLLEGLLDEARRGKRAESGFKKEAYTTVIPKIQAACKQEVVIDTQKCRNKVSEYKSLYSTWLTLQSLSGWGIDPETRMIVAEEETWTTYIKVSYLYC
jgi:hypothetical protein